MGTAVSDNFCRLLATELRSLDNDKIRVFSDRETYRFKICEIPVVVYTFRKKDGSPLNDNPEQFPLQFQGNNISNALREDIDRRVPQQQLRIMDSLPESNTPHIAVLGIALDFEGLDDAPVMILHGIWVGYPSAHDADGRITSWDDGHIRIATRPRYAMIPDEAIPSHENVLPFRPRLLADENGEAPSTDS